MTDNNLRLFARKLTEASSSVDYNISDDGKLHITIDLAKLNSRDTLVKEVKAIIKTLKDNIDSVIEKGGTRKKKDYDSILEIADLYAKLGSQKEVAIVLYNIDEDSLDYDDEAYSRFRSACNMVSERLKDYSFLVHGGYKFLTFP